LRDELESFFE
jgi:hypothetical protein